MARMCNYPNPEYALRAMMQPVAVNGRAHLCNLLAYAEEILKIGERVISDLAKDALMSFYEHDIASLDGVAAPGSDDCWLRVSRLREVTAPEPDEAHRPWMAPKEGKGPFDRPRLLDTKLVSVSIEEASDLIEAGLALEDDVMKPRGAVVEANKVDILLSLVNLPEFAAAFDEWMAGPWTAWADSERPRRRSIAFYNRLFETQQRMAAMGDDVPVEAVFGVGIARWNHPGGRVNAPVIEAIVELELDPEDGAIIVRARQQAPRLALRPFDMLEIEGVGTLYREASAQLERLYNDPDVGFSPYERVGYEMVLRMCQSRLSAAAVYERDIRENESDRTPPHADEKLRISDTWVLYIRQRSVNFRCEDIRRLTARIRDTEDELDLPAPALQMTTRPTDALVDDDVVDLGITTLNLPLGPHISGPPHGSSEGGSGSGTLKEEKAYFFPLPYNDDQIEIVRRLEDESVSGVVVQGPPGTGKTHTIANIIAHYMATGRRVLVSAHEPEALAAIQQKLPASIRDLAIAVIHSDREGSRQLEQAVDILASQVKQIDKRAYNEQRLERERMLSEIRMALSDTDERIRAYADQNLTAVTYRGEQLMPMDLAARVEADRPVHGWFPDELGMEARFEHTFAAEDITEVTRIRAELGADIVYSVQHLPEHGTFPDVPKLLVAHEAFVRERQVEARAAAGDLPYVSFGPGAEMDDARSLHAWLADLETWTKDIDPCGLWLADLYRMLVGAKPVNEMVRDGMRKLCLEWAGIYIDSQPFILRGVELPGMATLDPTFDAAVEALAGGRKPFGVFSFGQSALKAKIEAVRVDGSAPSAVEGWTCIRDYRAWQRRAQSFVSRWSAAAKALEFPVLSGDWDALATRVVELGGLVDRMHQFHVDAPKKVALVAALFPYGVDPQKVVFHFDASVVSEALSVSLHEEGHANAMTVRRKLDEEGELSALPFHSAVLAIRHALGDPDVVPKELADGWRSVLDEARRLDGLREQRNRLEAISAAVSESGAPKWAAALLQGNDERGDLCAPANWKDTWDWARADGYMRSISNRGTLVALSARRAALEERQRELLAEIVRLRTFIGLKQGITERVASALTKFGIKVRQLGAGTGKSAERHRRAIREATLEASEAVPCWILPEWRVAEQLPSELATFDLVIIDEASQSDITSLPAVLRGKKLLVVGDDKQVSPSAVGMEEKTVVQLRETFLRDMDIANYLEPTTSLYDLASMTVPGSVIMLREHFRCVEPIIRFSSRFYPKALVPLRLATAEERLDPPLIDIYVPHGRKVRDVNEAEATVISEEIRRLTEDPDFAGRSIGVISLIGDKQAKLIQGRLIETIGIEAITSHRIICGNASTFQGQERDIIFLSMVACPSTSRAQTARLMEQRFNVAMSRARDRMYLVRSVAASMLSEKDLKAAVIEHFRNPMGAAVIAQPKDVLEACDSDFERDVGKCLLDLGYRVRPQVPVGAFRIDFVVEGEGNRRLAVELDGDRYHGPERWAEDQHRQRAMERLGWVFWRCWGSHWLSDRQGSLDDLLATLVRLGIEPVGGDFSPQIWTEHRVIVDAAGAGLAAQVAAAELGHPVLATVDGSGLGITLTNAADPAPASTTPEHDRDAVVEAGDTVIVRFADDNRVRRFRLSYEANDPERGVVHIAQPIGEALLGNGIEEEIEIIVGGQSRRVIIEKITKAA
jgi:very-short-patch-repair endonuclease